MEAPKNKPPRKKKAAKKKQPEEARTAPTGSNLPAHREDNPENDVILQKEFEVYALWKSLPPILKGVTPRDLEDKFFLDDEELIQLLQLRTQRDFAKYFDLDEKTLWRWNGKLKDRDLFADIRAWSMKLQKNVVMSTYRAAMLKDPKANADRKLFSQINGWGEEMTVHNKGETLVELFKRGLGIE